VGRKPAPPQGPLGGLLDEIGVKVEL